MFLVCVCAWAVVGAVSTLPSTWLEFTEHPSVQGSFDRLFDSFQARFGVSYLDRTTAANALEQNARAVFAHNQASASFSLRLNKLSAMSVLEYRDTMLMKTPPSQPDLSISHVQGNMAHIPAAAQRSEAGVQCDLRYAATPVKDQGQCGSCWAFSVVAAAEAAHYQWAGGQAVSLSEQQLLNCCGDSSGCTGYYNSKAMQCLTGGVHALATEAAYPYNVSKVSDACTFKYEMAGAAMSYTYRVPSGNETALQKALGGADCSWFNTLAVSVCIDASHSSFQSYGGGVYREPACSTTNTNHCVAVYGWGTDPDGGDYWLVKNSWGDAWGEQGYIRMARNNGNMCAIASYAYYFDW